MELGLNRSLMEQENRINVLNARAIDLEFFNSFRALVVQDEDLSRIWSAGVADGELDSLDLARFDMLCKNYLWNSVTQWERGEVLGEEFIEASVNRRAGVLEDSPGLQRCWTSNVAAMRTLGFEAYVDAVDAARRR